MKVIAITGRDEDLTIAVVPVLEGQTGDDAFLAWIKSGCKGGHCGYNTHGKSDEEILDNNTEYAFNEFSV